jgi:allophanate hydrolase
MADSADGMLPVTRSIVESADRFSAADAFAAIYKLAGLRRATLPVWDKIAALAVPAVPNAPALASVAADPIGPNSRLGTYTNFVNLLDLAALAVPGPWRADGRPAGVTFIGPHGSDSRLASIGRAFHSSCGLTIGATGRRVLPLSL